MARAIRTISAFKSKLAGGAARPNLFEVEIPASPPSWREIGTMKLERSSAHGKGSSITCF